MHKKDLHYELSIPLPPGVHHYKYIIDGSRWCYDITQPTLRDEKGNINNAVHIQGEVEEYLINPLPPLELQPQQKQKQEKQQKQKQEKQKQEKSKEQETHKEEHDVEQKEHEMECSDAEPDYQVESSSEHYVSGSESEREEKRQKPKRKEGQDDDSSVVDILSLEKKKQKLKNEYPSTKYQEPHIVKNVNKKVGRVLSKKNQSTKRE
eukprot:TRINITY_DN237_c0_g1_i1.p1 TRINITY_DN237_c0_g1~~TRINITY_DN237_c0_g1_i1.p1  ORF type:complete len:221 (+),score=67.11 TRINITY_DN237_c0_g1_i1:43-663(+)